MGRQHSTQRFGPTMPRYALNMQKIRGLIEYGVLSKFGCRILDLEAPRIVSRKYGSMLTSY